METACLRHTDIPHTSRLFSDFQYHFDRVNKYFAHYPGDFSSYAAAARQIQYPDERRAALVAALRARNGDSAALELLAKPGTVAVLTGQQVGLFSGPAYTIYKALTAVRLAQKLTDSGQPAVPIFWLATEDHDLAEVNHAFVFGRDQQPVKVSVDAAGEPQQPVGTIGLGHAPLGELREILQPFPFGDEVADLVDRTYAGGVTFGQAFEQLLRTLLAKWGLLFLDPLDHPIRAIAAPFLAEALRRAPDLKGRVLERSKALVADGYHAQVLVDAHSSFFFVLDGARRKTLRAENGGGYASKDRFYTVDELAANAEHLSPNALLRPVVQDYLLPTVAYIGGPAELAYLAQSRVIYDELLGRMPVVLARSSFTLLDSRANKLMDRYDLGLPCFFHGEECLREKISAKLIPAELTAQFQQLQAGTAAGLDQLRGGLTAFDPTLAAALDKSRAKVLYQLGKLEKKAARETLRRDARASEESRYLSGLIFPEKHLQERYYSILPFLAKHGLELLDTLYDAINLDCPDHKILVV
jgi:bacillithiol biosynthesis cysteine-adding enzyme BshC